MIDYHPTDTENERQLRILYLYRILQRYTDQENPLSTRQLVEMMEDLHQIKMHRTTLPRDIATLRSAGVDIVEVRSRDKKYFLAERVFESTELKLLVDAVGAARFISQKKSEDLTTKLASLACVETAKKIKRNSFTPNRVKTFNEKLYYIVDALNEAINQNCRILLYYTTLDRYKETILKNNALPYEISPYTLMGNGDYYYLVGFNHQTERLATFRVDRIAIAPELLDEPCFPMPEDAFPIHPERTVFRMYASDTPVEVTLYCENDLMNHVVDQFGMEVYTEVVGEDGFLVRAMVYPGPTFYRWIFGWNGRMKLLSPKSLVDVYHEMARQALKE